MITPDWQFEADTAAWKQVWDWHHKDSLLMSAGRSNVFLFLHRRPWLAQKPRNQRRLDSYATLNDIPQEP